MKLSRLFDRQTGRLAVVVGMLVASLLPAISPVVAGAAQVTTRSIALSSSSADADNVTYQVNFTSVGAAGAFVVDFCSNTPLYGEDCTAPSGFSASSAASTTTGFTDVSALDANTIVVAGTIDATTAISVDITGINNPTSAGALYARIVTFNSDTNADAYVSNPDTENPNTGMVDNGGVALSITPTIGVSGAVLESMTFCVSGAAITDACETTTAPTLKLGEDVGAGVIALSSDAVSTGSVYTQISTNASGGAVISLKSSAVDCGGLLRAGDLDECDIAPALQTDIEAGQAKFGVKTATATALDGDVSNGTYQPVTGSGYNNTTFALNYVDGNATGVTSVYGDPFLDTDSGPVNTMNMQLTFGASVANNTPAGNYSADISLIATGKF